MGQFNAGKIGEEKLKEYERKTCPTCGSCSGMYTANSMNCLTEALGMGLRGNGTIPAVYSGRIELAKRAGMAVMELVKRDIRPRDIMTEAALADLPGVELPHRLGDRGEAGPSAVDAPRQHGPAADKNGWNIQPRRRHEEAGDVLVAVGDHHQGVEAVGQDHGLGGVGDEVPGDQGVFHPLVAHASSWRRRG